MSFAGDPARTKKQAEKNAAMAAWSSLKRSTLTSQPRKVKSCADLCESQSIDSPEHHDSHSCSAGGAQGAGRRRRAGPRDRRKSSRRAEASRRRQGGAFAKAVRHRIFSLCSSEPVAVQTPMAASEHPCSAAEDGAPAAAGWPQDPASPAPAAATGVELHGRRGGGAGAHAGEGHREGQGRRGGTPAVAVLLRSGPGVPPRRRAEILRRGRVPRAGRERAIGDPGVRRPAAAAAGQAGTEWPSDILICRQEGVSSWPAFEAQEEKKSLAFIGSVFAGEF
jgi:hypothetical protein